MKLTAALNKFLRKNTQGTHSIFHQPCCHLNPEGFTKDAIFWLPSYAAALVKKEAETYKQNHLF